jgi:hypothetical protein
VDVDRHGRNVDVDVDVDHGHRGAARAAVRVGTRVFSLPRGCTKVVYGGIVHHNCSGVYYKPCYEGTTVVYVVVEAP